MIRLDRSQIHQAILNLAVNATEAIGGKPGRIELRTKRVQIDRKEMTDFVVVPERGGREFVSLEVSDNGVGIPADDLKKIFDPFFTTKFMGRGLGLAAVQGILRRHEGGLSAHSEVGRGTTIQLLLPVGQE